MSAAAPGSGRRYARLAALGAALALAALSAGAAKPSPPPAAAKSPAATAAGGAVEYQSYGRFGQVAIYRHPGRPEGVVVLLSDDSGWDGRAETLARSLQSIGALVIGLDVAYYDRKSERLTQDCAYPAGDFEMLSKLVQKKLELPTYTAPVVAGFGEGATLAYGALAQSPNGTFAGAISLGFCPDLDALPRPRPDQPGAGQGRRLPPPAGGKRRSDLAAVTRADCRRRGALRRPGGRGGLRREDQGCGGDRTAQGQRQTPGCGRSARQRRAQTSLPPGAQRRRAGAAAGHSRTPRLGRSAPA
jgi:hypothetical protein